MLVYTPTRVQRDLRSLIQLTEIMSILHQLLKRHLWGETYNSLKEEAFSQNINHIQLWLFRGYEKFVQKFKWHC